MASSFLRFLDHTRRRITVGRTPLDEWSARHRDLYLTTHNTHNWQTSMPPSGIRTHDLSRRAAADLHLRPCGHWDWHPGISLGQNDSKLYGCKSCIIFRVQRMTKSHASTLQHLTALLHKLNTCHVDKNILSICWSLINLGYVSVQKKTLIRH